MRILLIAYACEPNKGSEPGVGWKWAVNLAKFTEVTVITSIDNKKNIEVELGRKLIKNLSFIYYNLNIFKRIKKKSSLVLKLHYLLWVKSIKRFIKKNIQIKNYDIIHFITFNTFVITPPIYSLGIKSVWGPVGGGIVGHLESFKKVSMKEYLKELSRTALIIFLSNSKKLQNTLQKYDKIIFANSETAKLLNYEHTAIIELETGINEARLLKAINNKSDSKNKIRVLAAGILETRKGYHILLDALKSVKSNIELIILGQGSKKKYLTDLVIKNNLENVKFLGEVNYKEILTYYLESDLFVFPSIRDTSGNVVLEAMSQSLPIIAFDHQGMHDILTNECAIKIPVTNYEKMVKDLAKAIDKIASNYRLRIEMGKASLQRIKNNYLWIDKTKKILIIYNEILK